MTVIVRHVGQPLGGTGFLGRLSGPVRRQSVPGLRHSNGAGLRLQAKEKCGGSGQTVCSSVSADSVSSQNKSGMNIEKDCEELIRSGVIRSAIGIFLAKRPQLRWLEPEFEEMANGKLLTAVQEYDPLKSCGKSLRKYTIRILLNAFWDVVRYNRFLHSSGLAFSGGEGQEMAEQLLLDKGYLRTTQQREFLPAGFYDDAIRECLLEAIAKITNPVHCKLLTMHLETGENFQDIGRKMGMKRGTICTAVMHAKDALRIIICDRYPKLLEYLDAIDEGETVE